MDAGVQVALEAGSAYIFGNNETYEKRLKELGTAIIDLSPAELKPFREKVQPVWDLLKKNVPPAVYDAYTNALR
jgi:TRAP-type C4-dicarboxylate transport system substrate-binding protein